MGAGIALFAPTLMGNQNAALELAKQRNAALADTWAIHPLAPGSTPELGQVTEATKQMFYLSLASSKAVKLTAKENAKGLGACVNDLSEPCRKHFVQQIAASRAEFGSGEVSDSDLELAMKPILDNMEAALQSAADSGQIQLPNGPTNNEQPWVSYGTTKEVDFNGLVQAVVTPAFRMRFPSSRYSIVMINSVVGESDNQYCFVAAGVSAKSAGTKTLRVPAARFLASVQLKKSATPTDLTACHLAATKSALNSMMATDPDELARITETSI